MLGRQLADDTLILTHEKKSLLNHWHLQDEERQPLIVHGAVVES